VCCACLKGHAARCVVRVFERAGVGTRCVVLLHLLELWYPLLDLAEIYGVAVVWILRVYVCVRACQRACVCVRVCVLCTRTQTKPTNQQLQRSTRHLWSCCLFIYVSS